MKKRTIIGIGIGVLIVILLVSSIFYFVLLDPTTSIHSCDIYDAEIWCKDILFQEEGQSKVIIFNNKEHDVRIASVEFVSESSNFVCENNIEPVILNTKNEVILNLGPGAGCIDSTTGYPSRNHDDFVKGKITLRYTLLDSEKDYVVEGQARSIVEKAR